LVVVELALPAMTLMVQMVLAQFLAQLHLPVVVVVLDIQPE
jgi:hypothetical protein